MNLTQSLCLASAQPSRQVKYTNNYRVHRVCFNEKRGLNGEKLQKIKKLL